MGIEHEKIHQEKLLNLLLYISLNYLKVFVNNIETFKMAKIINK